MNPKLTRIRALILLCAALAIVFVLVRRARAQQPPPAAAPAAAQPLPLQGPSAPAVLHGTVVDPSGKPVAAQKLTLHRVDNVGGGAMVDSATSDDQGRFSVHVPAERDTAAVYFVATRWQGQLYIGTPFKPPVPAGMPYDVVVGVNPVNMGPAGGSTGGPAEAGPMGPAGATTGAPAASSDGSIAARWFLAILLALVALVAIGYAMVGALRERARENRRELLARIAALDERAQRARGDEAARLQRERAQLLAELAGD